jgi:Tfp pilus assembly protein PilN
MKAVNLLPQDLRRASGSAGATGNAVYVLLGALGVCVVLVAAWAMASRSVAQGESDVRRFRAEADAAELRAGQLKPYAAFSAIRAKRVETVTSLSRSRFNWPFALREVSRVLPENVWLTRLVGTVAPGIQMEDAPGGPTTPLRGQLNAPAIEISGCTTSQEKVADYLARLRSIQGVTRVSLAATEKLEAASGGQGGGEAGDDCRAGDDDAPQFDLVIFFESSTATSSSSAGTSAPASTLATETKGTSK